MVLTGLIGLFLALTFLSLLIVRRVYLPAQSSNRSVCDTEDCIAHARSILANLNESANPCVDFHAHVCGGSIDDAGRRDYAHSGRGSPLARAYSEVMHTLGNAETFRAANHSSVAATKAFAAVTNCVESSRHSAADSFAAFMRDRGITWPLPASTSGKNATAANVLDILLDLAVNWRVCLWFSVVASHTATLDGVPAVVFGEPGDIPALRMEQLAVYDDEVYADVVRSLSRYLTDGKVAPDDVAVKELRVDDAAFQGVLLSREDDNDDDDFDIVIPLSNITEVFGDVLSKADWSGLLNKHLNNVIGDVSNSTRLYILNKKRFGRLGRLVGSLPAPRLLNVVGWTFAYAYVWTVNADFDNPSSPGTAGCLAADTLCFVSVQESFGIAQAQPVFMDAFDVTERQKVTAVLRETSAALTQAVLASSVISNATKLEAVEKAGSLTRRHQLWPPEPYPQGGSAFDTLYVNFSGTKKTVFDGWIESRKSLRAALPSPYYESLLTSRYRWHSGSALYLYALNELRLSLSALFPPTYVRHGSSTMTFAGLGFKLARQMVRSVDLHGRSLDSVGRNTSWWQRQDKQGQSSCRLDLAASTRDRRLLGDLLALDVAHDAMRKSSSWAPSHYSPPRLKLLEKLTSAQTFYVSYCSRLCDEPYGRLACNLAMNASRFGEAFGCPFRVPKGPTCVFV
ncbi:hypothetical protein HPB49_023733 [Dermacentor silvarum]|uniref:Uncharacterized protein n=1 Tax=Dermacentor silvarum TaxID=543639 RepID=A0ACB8CTD4_DERSI|nr:hypothetical protein HPB49_023733 [Dermacentor silvarum]